MLIANVLMRQNAADYPDVRALAAELGVECTIDPTITPKMDGDTSIVACASPAPQLLRVFTDKSLVGEIRAAEPSLPTDEECWTARPCSAGHTACYISPYGDVYPCVQFPLPTGNVRQQRFDDIWRRLAAAEGGARDSHARSADLFELQFHAHVHAMPRPRLHGGKHARPVVGRLRKVPTSSGRCDDRRDRIITGAKEYWHES